VVPVHLDLLALYFCIVPLFRVSEFIMSALARACAHVCFRFIVVLILPSHTVACPPLRGHDFHTEWQDVPRLQKRMTSQDVHDTFMLEWEKEVAEVRFASSIFSLASCSGFCRLVIKLVGIDNRALPCKPGLSKLKIAPSTLPPIP